MGAPAREDDMAEPVGLNIHVCPVCGRKLSSRTAGRKELLYGDAESSVWGEKSVLVFDYKAGRHDRVLDGLRREWIAEGSEIVEVCECLRVLAVEAHFARQGIPVGLARKSFQSFIVTEGNAEAYQACHRFGETFSAEVTTGIALYGPVGVGKTHLAAAILAAIVRRNITSLGPPHLMFASVPLLLREIAWLRNEAQPGGQRDIFQRLFSDDLLVLDDLGLEQITDDTLQDIFLIINGRLNAAKPTIMTTNFEPQALKEKVGVRIGDRLLEACEWYEIRGESFRGKLPH